MMRIDDDDNNFPTTPCSYFTGIAFEDVYLNYHFRQKKFAGAAAYQTCPGHDGCTEI